MTTLRSVKYVFTRPSGTFEQPKWVGPGSMLGSLSEPLGELVVSKASAVRTHHRLGKFRLASSAVRAPGVTTAALTVKQRVGVKLASLGEVYQDIDILTKLSCHTVDAFNDWETIKRLSKCIILSNDVDGETAYTPEANGEPIVSLPVASTERTTLIKQVVVQELFRIYFTYVHFKEGHDSKTVYPVVAADRVTGNYVFGVVDASLNYTVGVGPSVENLDVMDGLLPTAAKTLSIVDNIIIADCNLNSTDAIEARTISGSTDTGYIRHTPQDVIHGVDILVVGAGGIVDGYFRFRDVQIPQGADIVSAYIDFIRSDPTVTDVQLKVEGELSAYPTNLGTYANYLLKPHTATNVAYAAPITNPRYTVEPTPDISVIIQPIINLKSWVIGNNLGIFLLGTSGTAFYSVFDTFDLDAGEPVYQYRPTLYVTFSVFGAFVSQDYGMSFTGSLCNGSQCRIAHYVDAYSHIMYEGDADGAYISKDGGLNAEAFGGLVTGGVLLDYYNGHIQLLDRFNRDIYATDYLSARFYKQATNVLAEVLDMSGGLIAGRNSSNNLVVLGSEDGFVWDVVFTLADSVDVDVTMLLEYANFGVYYLSIFYSPDSGVTWYHNIYRSVYWGVSGTWDMIYQDSALDAATIMRPYSMACKDVNNCVIVGRNKFGVSGYGGYYAIEISPEGEVD